MKKFALLTAALFASSAVLSAADVAANWAAHCASCHGKDGKGATKAGRTAGVKDFTDAAYQKDFTDQKAIDQIKNGMKDKDGKEKMKAFAEKMNDDEVKAVVAYIRTLAAPAK
jgi:mono/diheme cytochrome c family protein